MKLYEIDDAMAALIDPDTGELKDYEAFVALNMERERKIEGMVAWYKDMCGDAKKIKDEETTLKERRQVLEHRAARLKEYITRALGGDKFTSPKGTVSYRQSAKVEVLDQEDAAAWLEQHGYDNCLKYLVPEIKKDAVKQLLKEGQKIEGVVLTDNLSTIIK